MNTRTRSLALAGALCLALGSLAWAEMPAKPQGRVSDFAGVIPEAQEAQLAGLLEYISSSLGAEVEVVTVTSLDGQSVDTYANQLFAQWEIGDKEKDNGVLLLIAPHDRKVRIEVGYGLEPVLTDGRCGRILDEHVLPAFKAGEYGKGALNGCTQIMTFLMNQDSLPADSNAGPPATTSDNDEPSWQMKVGIMLFFAIFITIGFLALGSGLGKGGEPFFVLWGAGFGGIPLVMSIMFSLFMNFPIYILPALAVVMFIIGKRRGKKFLKSALASGHIQVNGRTYTGGGSSFGGFSGGSSSGGFSGGSSSGGSSGGGGSSRSW